MKSIDKSEKRFPSQAGFTLAEAMIVAAIILVVAGLSIPSLSRTIDNSQLKGATQELAAVYQDTRLRATQNNTSYEVLVSPPGVTPAQVCIDLDGDGACGAGDPITIFSNKIIVSNQGVPVPLGPQLTFPGVTDTEHSSDAGTRAWRGIPVVCHASEAQQPPRVWRQDGCSICSFNAPMEKSFMGL